MKNIEDWSLLYELLRPLGRFVHGFAHKKIVTIGKENIPKNEPVILAPNHQNALSDSLSILLTTKLHPVFLGRADMFKKKWAAAILTFFKISPVFRIRDGKETLDKNQEVYDNCVRILKRNKMICIYPEAAHNGMKSMLPHKKAIPRIAFMAAESTNFEIDVKVVPVGLYYSHYFNFRRELCVHFGKPISSKDYYQLYKEQGEPKATLTFKNDLFSAIKELIVYVPDRSSYDIYAAAFETSSKLAFDKLGLEEKTRNRVEAEQFIADKIHSDLEEKTELKEELLKKAQTYKRLKSKLELTGTQLKKGEISLGSAFINYLAALILLPLGLYSTIANGWLFYLTRYSYRKKIKDQHFYSTLSFGSSFILFPIWYIIQFFILLAIFKNALIVLGILIFSFASNLIAWQVWRLFKDTSSRLKMTKLKKSGNKQYKQLMAIRSELISYFEKTIK